MNENEETKVEGENEAGGESESEKEDHEGDKLNEAYEHVLTKTNEQREKQAKALHKLYDGQFLTRLLRMLEIFTSVAQTQNNALAMV